MSDKRKPKEETTQIFQVQLRVIDGEYVREPQPEPVDEYSERYISPNEQLPYHNTTTLTPEMGWVPIAPTFMAEVKKGNKKDASGTDAYTLARTAFEQHRYNTLSKLLEQGIQAEMRLVSFVQSEVLQHTDCGRGVPIHQ